MLLLGTEPYEKKLPNEYIEVEYIESTGTQAIDTGVKSVASPKWVHEIKFQLVNTNELLIFGQTDNQPNFLIRIRSNEILMYYNNGINDGAYQNSYNFNTNTIYNLKVNDSTLTINGSVFNKFSNTGNTTSGNFGLFRIRGKYYKYRLYSCKITYNGIVQRDFVPCIRKSDNKAGLYDLANNIFYNNIGTGDFIIGKKLINHKEIISVAKGGNDLSKIILGDKIIWENWKYSTTTIKKEVYSSGGGWNTSFKWSSGWITLEKPIKNPTGKVTLSTRDTSGSNAKGYVRYSDGGEERVGIVDGGYHGANESWGGNKSFALTNDKEIVAYKIDGEHAKFSGGTTVGIEFNTYYQKG